MSCPPSLNLTLLDPLLDAAEADGDLKRMLATRTYLRLRQEIIGGEFEPGTKLKIRDLRLRYDAGLSPIREALSWLSTRGLSSSTISAASRWRRSTRRASSTSRAPGSG